MRSLGNKIAFFLIALTYFVTQNAFATEPPCLYPNCFLGEEIIEAYVYSGVDSELEIFLVAHFDGIPLVLIRYRNRMMKKPVFAEAYYLADKNKANSFVLELFGKRKSPYLAFTFTLSGPIGKALIAEVREYGKDVLLQLKRDPASEKRAKKDSLSRQYRRDRALRWFDEYQAKAADALDVSLTSLNKSCSSNLHGAVDRVGVSPKKLGDDDYQDIQYRCSEAVSAIAELCGESEKFKTRIAKNTILRCSFTTEKKSSFKIRGKELIFTVSINALREGRGPFDRKKALEQLVP